MRVQVVESVLKANDALAASNRKRMESANLLALNLMSAPGSGKTSLLEKTIPQLGGGRRCAVMVGDLQTSRDAERLGHVAAQTLQINTGKGCHLTPAEVAEGLNHLDMNEVDYLFIENVGNMVCPAAFDLGEHRRVVLLSVPEGDDKVAKYHTLFVQADAILLTKTDLLDVLDFDIARVRDDLSKINTHAPLIQISAKTGEGLTEWLQWLHHEHEAITKKASVASQSS